MPHRFPPQCGLTFGLALPQCVFSHGASQDVVSNRIRRVDIATGETTTLAGSGSAGTYDGEFSYPSDVAIDPSRGYALVTVRASGLDSLHPLDSRQSAIP